MNGVGNGQRHRSRTASGDLWALVLVGTGALLWAIWGAVAGTSNEVRRKLPTREPESRHEPTQELVAQPMLKGLGSEHSTGEPPAGSRPNPTIPPASPPTGSRVSGTVVSADSATPISGALVFIPPSGPNGVTATRRAVSDDDGRFSIPLDPDDPTEGFSIAASRAGYVPAVVSSPSLDEPNLIRMTTGASIAGRIVDTHGRPIAGRRVVAHARDHLFGWPHVDDVLSTISPNAGNTTYSGDDGSFQVAGLVEGQEYTIYASLDGYMRTTAFWPTATAPEADVEITLQAVATTRLRVIEAGSGEPVRSFAVTAAGGEGLAEIVGSSSHSATELDLTWITQRRSVEEGSSHEKGISFEVSALGYVSKAVEGSALSGRTDEMVVELTPSERYRRVTFQLEDEAGEPVHGQFHVVIGDTAYGQFLALNCDASGRSQALLAPVGTTQVLVKGGGVSTYWYTFEHPSSLTVPSLASEPGEIAVKLVVPGRRFELEVLTQDGTPCRGYSLSVVRRGSPPLGAHVLDWDLPSNEYLKSSGRAWNAKGTPTVLLPPGEWTVTANRAGLGLGATAVQCVSSSTHGTIRITLDPAKEWRPDLWVKRNPRHGGAK